MKYLSLFSGVGGFDSGLDAADMECVGQVEKDKTCLKVLSRHWPDIKKVSDVREVGSDTFVRPDCVCAGWPCQGNSVAGRRAGMADQRSGLWGEVVRVLAAFRPAVFLGENVPGILSVCGCHTCRSLKALQAMHAKKRGEKCDCPRCYAFAYRICDSQWWGLAQRRRRVFVVGCFGDWRRAAEVLFERESLPWDSPPSRETREGVAGTIAAGAHPGGFNGRDAETGNYAFTELGEGHSSFQETEISASFRGSGGGGVNANLIAHTLRAEGHDTSEAGTGRGVPLVAATLPASEGGVSSRMHPVIPVHASGCHNANSAGIGKAGDPMHAIDSTGDAAIAFAQNERDEVRAIGGNIARALPAQPGMKQQTYLAYAIQERAVSENITNGPQGKGYQEGTAYTLEARHHQQSVAGRTGVRRLTPTECERLQGFPDGWTEPHSDSARYRMLGNAVSVPVVYWIGKRIMEFSK